MRRRILSLLLLSILITPGVILSKGVTAQEGDPTILSNETIVDYPETALFRLELAEGQTVSAATLSYQLGQNNCLQAGTQVPVEIDGSTLEWTWVMSRSGNPPPGAVLSWEWHLVDSAGNQFTTPQKHLTFTDERFDWRSVSEGLRGEPGSIIVHWYEGESVGPILLEAAVAGLERLEQDTGIELQDQVQFYIYADSDDMREAMIYVQDWAGGLAFNQYNTILIGVPPYLAGTWGSETVRHELAHLVIGQFAWSCLGGSLPTWLSEGLAVYAEGIPDADTLSDIENGVEKNSFQPVRSLNGQFPAEGDEAGAAYSQSFSLVDYLLATYGQEKIQELLLVLADGYNYDTALEEIYGFNADGLEVEWRQSIGAQSRRIPPTLTPISAASIPTVVPLGAAKNQPTPPPENGDKTTTQIQDEANTSSPASQGSCALGLAPLFLSIGLVAAGPLLRRPKGERGRSRRRWR